jgi:energy-coupling factor transporter ATP-binding protein EcfA2
MHGKQQSHDQKGCILRFGDIIEIVGDQGSGKSELLAHLIGSCILPRCVGGNGSAAVYFDNDMRLDLRRLRTSLLRRTVVAMQGQNDNSIAKAEKLVDDSLESLRVYRCRNTLQFFVSLHQLESEVLQPGIDDNFGSQPFVSDDTSAHACSGDGNSLRMIAIDSLCTFYWGDRAARECTGAVSVRGSKLHGGTDDLQRSIGVLLERIRRHHPVFICASSPTIFAGSWDARPRWWKLQDRVGRVFMKRQDNGLWQRSEEERGEEQCGPLTRIHVKLEICDEARHGSTAVRVSQKNAGKDRAVTNSRTATLRVGFAGLDQDCSRCLRDC